MSASLSSSVCGLLSILARGAARGDVLCCRRNAGRVLGGQELRIPVHDLTDKWVPGPLLARLEENNSPWSVDLVLRGPDGRGLLLSAVGVWFTFDRICQNPRDPARPTGKRWIWPDRQIDAAIARVAAFLPPTMIVDGRSRLCALWSLAIPRHPRADDAACRRLFVQLAERVGPSVPSKDVKLSELTIPIPGFPVVNATVDDAELATCRELDLARIYTLEMIETAIQAAPPATTASMTTDTPAPHHRIQQEKSHAHR